MKVLGAHMSIEGGLDRAVVRGAEAGCDAVQLFTSSSNQWRARKLKEEEVHAFRAAQIEKGISPVVSHDSYLINLASPDEALHRRSVSAFGDEIDRCDTLGIPYLVTHPGAHVGSGEEAGIERIAAAFNQLFAARPDQKVRVLLETTAGQGTNLGHRFEHLARILEQVEKRDRVAVCVDTCHIFAAGYDIRTEKGYTDVMKELDRIVGLDLVRAFHLNDCKKDLGCRVDRHEHIGKGFIGLEGFRCLMNDPRFDGIPMLLETPKGEDCAEDRENLAVLRGLVAARK